MQLNRISPAGTRSTVRDRAAWSISISAMMALAILFALTAGIGVWAAYNRMIALEKFLLILAGLALLPAMAGLGRRYRDRAPAIITLGSAVTAIGLSVCYFLDLIWDSDLVAGSLMLLLPLAAGGLAMNAGPRLTVRQLLIGTALVAGLVALALTPERSAWFGLGVGCAGAVLWHCRCYWVDAGPKRRWFDISLSLILLAALAVYLTVLTTTLFDSAQFHPAFDRRFASRVILWRDTLGLIGDYPFSGSGLANTAMVYSSYIYLLHVPYQYHAHNLYLQIGVEQGLLGLALFCALAGVCLWSVLRFYSQSSSQERPYVLAAMVTLLALLVYGLFDSELYITGALPVIFLPLGYGVLILAGTTAAAPSMPGIAPGRKRALTGGVLGSAVAILVFLIAVSAIRLQGGAGVLAANLGAVSQTRAELSVYEWPQWSMQDVVRQVAVAELAPARRFYALALDMDPDNEVAHRRLGQIYLSLGEPVIACHHLTAAYGTTPAHRATRQLLGECYALQGQPAQAALLWKTIDTTQGQLDLRLWWHERSETNENSMRMADALRIHGDEDANHD